MSLLLIGANHRTAPVGMRERLAVPEEDRPAMLARLRDLTGLDGVSLLSTCNRSEILVSADGENVADHVVGTYAELAMTSVDEIEKHLYVLRNGDVVRHMFRVASGLDSMIVGEPQIAGQVRTAYRIANESGTLDAVLSRLYENTFRVAKKVRTDTAIGEDAVSVPFAAVELARKIFGEFDGLTTMILGAGKMGELTTKHLTSFGLENVLVANRSPERAADLARQFKGKAIPFETIGDAMRDCDIVIASTAAQDYVVHAADVRRALESRKRRDLFFIDLSVPRNVDPAVGDIDGAYLFNVDDLREVVDQNRELRQKRAADAEKIVASETETFLRRLASQAAIPTIVDLQKRLEEIRSGELDKCLRKMGPITTEQQKAIEILTTSIVNKILHYPIVRLRESAAEEDESRRDHVRDTIRKIFGLR